MFLQKTQTFLPKTFTVYAYEPPFTSGGEADGEDVLSNQQGSQIAAWSPSHTSGFLWGLPEILHVTKLGVFFKRTRDICNCFFFSFNETHRHFLPFLQQPFFIGSGTFSIHAGDNQDRYFKTNHDVFLTKLFWKLQQKDTFLFNISFILVTRLLIPW